MERTALNPSFISSFSCVRRSIFSLAASSRCTFQLKLVGLVPQPRHDMRGCKRKSAGARTRGEYRIICGAHLTCVPSGPTTCASTSSMSMSETCTPATSSSTSPGSISPHSHAGPPLDTLPPSAPVRAERLLAIEKEAHSNNSACTGAIHSYTPTRCNTCTTTTWHKGGLGDLAPRSFFLNLIPTPAKGTKRSTASSSSCVTRTKQRLAAHYRHAHGRPGTAQPRNRETGQQRDIAGAPLNQPAET